MYGGGGLAKLGRGAGAGRGGGKRALPPPGPPRQAARLPPGGGGGRGGRLGPGGGAPPPAREETFSLAPGDSLDFAAIIRLTPDLVDEIRRVEAQGVAARIKFDSNPNNPSGSVIDVGGKEFRFTWSRELGGLCDIYEERRKGEDGHGLLVECGSTWRKLNVQRILDESTKNHVKMRSEEAERLLKSRKAIILDPANPSVKNQAKTMAAAAVEGSMRRMGWKQKKEPFFKKRKSDPPSGPTIGTSKSVSKAGISYNSTNKAIPSVSPLPSPEQPGPGTTSSPMGTGNFGKDELKLEEVAAPWNISKEETGNSGKEIPSLAVHGTTHEGIGSKRKSADQQSDLGSLLITLLSENPKGMSLKALEKAVGVTIPNAGKQIESIIKNIATFQAPGRYLLKPGIEVKNPKKQASESESCPENADDQIQAIESMLERGADEDIEQQNILCSKEEEESDPFAFIDGIPNATDSFNTNTKVGNENEGRTITSSESGSDTESDSDTSDSGSDSGSQSRSRSKSRSPAGSASASSSDSESDNTSSSKEGSDVDVDIMTSDDEKDETTDKAAPADPQQSSSPREWKLNDDEPEQNCIDERNQVGNLALLPVDLNHMDMGDDEMAEAVEIIDSDPYHKDSRFPEEKSPFSPEERKKPDRQQESCVRFLANDVNEQIVGSRVAGICPMQNDRSVSEQTVVTEGNSRTKSKRDSDREEFQEKPNVSKRSRAASSAQVMHFRKSKDDALVEDLQNLTPDKSKLEQCNYSLQTDCNAKSTAAVDINMQNDSLPMFGSFRDSGNVRRMQQGPDFYSGLSFDGEQSGQRVGDFNGRRRAVDHLDKSTRYAENLGQNNKPPEALATRPDECDASSRKNIIIHEKVPLTKGKLNKDLRDEKIAFAKKYMTENVNESVFGAKLSSSPDAYDRKSGEAKDTGQAPLFQKSDIENAPVVNGKGSVLRRELSDLELGEFREPPAGEETVGFKRLFERKSSFKSSDNMPIVPGDSNLDVGRENPAANSVLESRKRSPSGMRVGFNKKQDRVNKRIEDNGVNSTWPPQRANMSQSQLFLKAHVDSEVVSRLDKSTEKAFRNERQTNQIIGFDDHIPQNDHRHSGQMGDRPTKDPKPQKVTSMRDSADQRTNNLWMDCNRRESSSDEDSFFYSKYEKDEPELKGPIRDYAQYKEYVVEYREKYGDYCSLNKHLENLRKDFLKIGRDLDLAKGRDSEEYYNILGHLKEMYQQHGEKNKQMKRVFIVLHEELKHLKQRIKDFAQSYAQD